MQIFINEVSLQGQYLTNADFEKSIKQFTSILTVINSDIKNGLVYKDSKTFLNYQAIKDKNFQRSLNKLTDPSLKRWFIDKLFNKTNPIEWRSQRLSRESDNFDCLIMNENYKNVQDTTLAEVAERKIQGQTKIYLVINFIESCFNDRHPEILECCQMTVIKNNDDTNLIQLDGIDTKVGLEKWIQCKLLVYDSQSNYPPQDKQTVLVDPSRFKKTNYRSLDDRTVYAEIGTRKYWYVDNLHWGLGAHLEVFDQSGRHIGEANLDGDIDESKQDSSKRFKP